MHSFSQRVLEILTMSVSVGFVGLLIVVASSFAPLGPKNVSPIISVFNVSMSPLMRMPMPVIYAQGQKPPPLRDYVFFKFTLRADFTPVWDWNTKAVYVACVARYRTENYVLNEVILLDTVLKSKAAAAQWSLENAQKYTLEDAHPGALAGVQVQLSIRYQLLRYCGHSPMFEVSPVGKEYPVLELPKTYGSVKMKDWAL
ncbi:peptide hydrolase [Trypanosoma cruzi]|uniref:Signal peptidase complex subunit 3 n=1 Tax=Trypanosoma cruzi TaxID=5693 RepID=A0A2V2V3S4_TRYCR|nr:putative signal peptidase subunit [Trypanosoma cruzi]PBJ81178.1 hypothetical protein BCY84_00534 [Trypanosoma cruzi cruzi]PWU90146.1 hypothetical protein C4B63_53g155 [Trypanosoma cruzi]RNF22098.1 peptide hydrolase [Trypanosoma cruzi]